MKTSIFAVFALCMLANISGAQDLTIIFQGDTVKATRWKPDAKVWIAELKGEKFYLVRDSVIRSLSFDTDSALAVVRHHEEVLRAQQALLGKYETFQTAAEKHIAKQNEIIAIGDSLYRGYKSIYEDLKRVTGFSTWSIAASLIPVRTGDTHLLYSLGFGYGNISLQYVGGKDTDGILIGYRYPF
jgi:hypothetical protein